MSGGVNAVCTSPNAAKQIPCTLNKIFMEVTYATDMPNVILLELLAFSVASLFWGDVFCSTRAKAFTDHSHLPIRSQPRMDPGLND